MYVEMIDETGQVSEAIKKQTLDLLQFAAEKTGKDNKEMAVTFVTNERSEMLDEFDAYIGELFISVDKAREQAEEYGHSFEREMGFLAVHGFYISMVMIITPLKKKKKCLLYRKRF